MPKKTKKKRGIDLKYFRKQERLNKSSRRNASIREERDLFKRFKKKYPRLTFDNVVIITKTALKMKSGKIYRIHKKRGK